MKNSSTSAQLQPDRLLLIKTFCFDRKDTELLRIMPFLHHTASRCSDLAIPRLVREWVGRRIANSEDIINGWIITFQDECLLRRIENRAKAHERLTNSKTCQNQNLKETFLRDPFIIQLIEVTFYLQLGVESPLETSHLSDILNDRERGQKQNAKLN